MEKEQYIPYVPTNEKLMIKELIGQKVLAVHDQTIYLENGKCWEFQLDGDCCSVSSYTIEGEAAFKELIGRTITGVEHRNGPSTPDVEQKYPDVDVISWHFLVLITDKGHITVDWRNDSNGYYDGSCFITERQSLHPVAQDALMEGMTLEEALEISFRAMNKSSN